MNLDGLCSGVLTRMACFCLKKTFDVASAAMGNVSEETSEKKEGKKKREDLIHSHRCVTLLLPQQEFTTEPMTKGQAPMQPIVAWRTIRRL